MTREEAAKDIDRLREAYSLHPEYVDALALGAAALRQLDTAEKQARACLELSLGESSPQTIYLLQQFIRVLNGTGNLELPPEEL